MKRANLLCLTLVSLLLGLAAPAQAQDGLVMRNIFGKIGLLPEEKDPIEYRERPGLVVPKDTSKLRAPEPEGVHAKNGQWPVDPDVKAREDEKRRRDAAVIFPTRNTPTEGARLSVDDLAKGRSARGAVMGERNFKTNDRGERLSIEEMTAASKLSSAPTYPPGTEPPRKYLTDPPVGSRIPSMGAAIGKRTQDGPAVDDFDRAGSPWKRVD